MKEEIKHLEYVENKLDKFANDILNNNEYKKGEAENLQKYFVDNDSKLSDDEILNIFEKVDNYFSAYEYGLKQLLRIKKLKKSPYFGRIDFDDDLGSQKIYIGLNDILDEDGKSLITDWRAPVSSLYYDSDLGKTFYSTNERVFNVNLKNKRQICVKNGKFEYAYDTDQKIDDNLLVKLLMNQKSSSNMKNIVNSIQKEQNKLIRTPSYISLIINGIAGSGKTSIAMHRLAYLLYSDKTIQNENLLIISPNELFSNYLSSLLPELGEENAYTVSMRTLLSEHFGFLAQAETRAEMLEDAFVHHKNRLKTIQQKYTPEYAEMLMDFLANVDIVDIVENVYTVNRLIDLKKMNFAFALTKDNRFRIYRKIEFILDDIMNKYYSKASEDKQNELKEEFRTQIVTKLLEANLFKQFIEKYNINTKTTTRTTLAYDDISTCAFINFCILGFKSKAQYKQVFIDEIQDYDAISLKILRELLPNAKFIIVGDTKQNLICETDNIAYLQSLLPFATHNTLNICYRSTIEIMNLANALINYTYNGEMLRHGEKPTLYITNNVVNKINSLCKNIDENDYVAVICKSNFEAQQLAKELSNFALIDSERVKKEDIDNKRIITTIHLSKGLEFDNVIIPFVEIENFASDLDKQILYIMTTRALHNSHFILEKNKDSILLQNKYAPYINIVK